MGKATGDSGESHLKNLLPPVNEKYDANYNPQNRDRLAVVSGIRLEEEAHCANLRFSGGLALTVDQSSSFGAA